MSDCAFVAAPSMDLILDEDGLEQFNTLTKSFGEGFEKKIDLYIEILNAMCSHAVKEGELHNKLSLFLSEAKQCKGEMKLICEEIMKKNKEMKEGVDRADGDFYKNGEIF